MRTVRKSEARGRTRTGWLESYHSFSFGEYHDPAHMGFGPLRVINEDFIAPGGGFPMHGHRDMEIITYVLSGALEHKDSLGTGSVIRPGEVQMMRAGKGILHSEFNPSDKEPVHLLQIWIMPGERGLKPVYQQKAFDVKGLTLLAAPDGAEGALAIAQDARVFAGKIAPGEEAAAGMAAGRRYWLQVARGSVAVDDATLAAGDALAVAGEEGALGLRAGKEGAEVLLFDMAA